MATFAENFSGTTHPVSTARHISATAKNRNFIVINLIAKNGTFRESVDTYKAIPTLYITPLKDYKMRTAIPASRYGTSDATNKVLRNTYALLALSMLPTIAGAWVGLATGILHSMGPLVTFILFMAVSLGMTTAIFKFRNSGVGVALLLGYTFFMGVMVSGLLGFVLSKQGGASLVAQAFGITAGVFAAMAALSSVVKRDLSRLGNVLMVGALLLIFASLANIFFQSTAFQLAISTMAAGIFSTFILVDLKRVRDGHETNYVTATLGVYLSVLNVFQSVLSLLGLTSD